MIIYSLVLLLVSPSLAQFFPQMQAGYLPMNQGGMGLSGVGPQPYQIEEIYEIPVNVPSYRSPMGMGNSMHGLFQQSPFGNSYMGNMGGVGGFGGLGGLGSLGGIGGLGMGGLGGMGLGRGGVGHDFQTANVMNLINDKENFQVS
uniref:Uncharacterized protein n=1 Tax=Steinernema glaseri TaxID=37863 RepID=A0A1I7YVS5_9BILA